MPITQKQSRAVTHTTAPCQLTERFSLMDASTQHLATMPQFWSFLAKTLYRQLSARNLLQQGTLWHSDSTTPFTLPQVIKRQAAYQWTPPQLLHSQISYLLPSITLLLHFSSVSSSTHQVAKNNTTPYYLVAPASITTLYISPLLISSTTGTYAAQVLVTPAPNTVYMPPQP